MKLKLLILISLTGFVLVFQNCSSEFNSSTVKSIDPDAPPTNGTDPNTPPPNGVQPSLTGNFDLKAFPGAEGFGSESIGGRGGEICFVENLNSSGVGSFRSCIEMTGPRIVVFKTGGTITVAEPLIISNPFISIYGQTAPGDGILLRATPGSIIATLSIQTHDVLIQHLRVRAGSSTVNAAACCRDSLSIGSATPNQVYNVVLDHNSISWGIDEIAEIWFDSHDLTLSYNIFSEGLFDNGSNTEGPAGRGFLIGDDGANSISLHHNFFAHSYQRNPLIKTSGVVDVVNNLIYHWISRGGGHDGSYDGQKINWVKNKYIARTNDPNTSQNTSVGWGDILITARGGALVDSAYFEDNIGNNRPNNAMPQWSIANTDFGVPYDPQLGYHVETRFTAPTITELDVDDLEEELPKTVGATLPQRDAVDTRVISELRTKTGIMPNCVGPNDRPGEDRCDVFNVGGYPTMNQGQPDTDTDADGIPDEWENLYGLDPLVKDSLADRDGDGYLNIEEWVYSLSL